MIMKESLTDMEFPSVKADSLIEANFHMFLLAHYRRCKFPSVKADGLIEASALPNVCW